MSRRARLAASLTLSFLQLSSALAGAQMEYVVETVAGTGARGSRDGRAAEAEFYDPGSLAVAEDGSLYVGDSMNGVRRVHDGIVSTLPLPWQQYYVQGVAVRDTRLFLAVAVPEETRPERLRSTLATYDLESGAVRDLSPGTCITLSSPRPYHCLNEPHGVSLMEDAVLTSTFFHSTVYAVDFDGGNPFLYAGHSQASVAAFGGTLNDGGAAQGAYMGIIGSIDVDGEGNLYLTDAEHCLVRRVDRRGIIRTVAGGKGLPQPVLDEACGYSGDGAPAVLASLGDHPTVGVGPKRDLFIAHRRKIRYVDAEGRISTIAGRTNSTCDADGGCCAGDGGPALEADLSRPNMGDVTADGVVYFLESDGCPRVRALRRVR